MARATFVKAAAKDYPAQGIKKGESYWWWKFRYGSRQISKTEPRRSQLTQSEFYGQVYDIEDEIGALSADDGLQSAVEDIASRLREIGEQCTEKRDNMPEGLQDSETGTLLEERASAMESAADELEAIDFDDNPEDYWTEKLDEVVDAIKAHPAVFPALVTQAEVDALSAGDGLQGQVTAIIEKLQALLPAEPEPHPMQQFMRAPAEPVVNEPLEAAIEALEAVDFSDAPEDYWQGKLDEVQAVSIDAP